MDGHSQRIDELRTLIVHHWERYHEADAPEIPDADFDVLLVELRTLEAERPDLVTADSPTRRIGAAGRSTFDEVAHRVPMRSLDNAFDIDELRAWSERVVKRLAADGAAEEAVENVGNPPAVTWACELKFDGLAVSIRYEDGVLVQAATRGDGSITSLRFCVFQLEKRK